MVEPCNAHMQTVTVRNPSVVDESRRPTDILQIAPAVHVDQTKLSMNCSKTGSERLGEEAHKSRPDPRNISNTSPKSNNRGFQSKKTPATTFKTSNVCSVPAGPGSTRLIDCSQSRQDRNDSRAQDQNLNVLARIAADPNEVRDTRRMGKSARLRKLCGWLTRSRLFCTRASRQKYQAANYPEISKTQNKSYHAHSRRHEDLRGIQKLSKAAISRPLQRDEIFLADRFNKVHRKPAASSSAEVAQSKDASAKASAKPVVTGNVQKEAKVHSKSKNPVSSEDCAKSRSAKRRSAGVKQAKPAQNVQKSSWRPTFSMHRRNSTGSDLSFACQGLPGSPKVTEYQRTPRGVRRFSLPPLPSLPESEVDDHRGARKGDESPQKSDKLFHSSRPIPKSTVEKPFKGSLSKAPYSDKTIPQVRDHTRWHAGSNVQDAAALGNLHHDSTRDWPSPSNRVHHKPRASMGGWGRAAQDDRRINKVVVGPRPQDLEAKELESRRTTACTRSSASATRRNHSAFERQSPNSPGCDYERCSCSSIQPLFSRGHAAGSFGGQLNRETEFYDFYDELDITRPKYRP